MMTDAPVLRPDPDSFRAELAEATACAECAKLRKQVEWLVAWVANETGATEHSVRVYIGKLK